MFKLLVCKVLLAAACVPFSNPPSSAPERKIIDSSGSDQKRPEQPLQSRSDSEADCLVPTKCPHLDRDEDGIADHTETCPSDPENFNGFQDSDGCIDQIPDKLRQAIESAEYSARDGLALTRGGRVGAPLRAVIQRVARAMQAYPEIRILIIVYGMRDEALYGQDPTLERAEAIKTLIIREGKAGSDRLETVGAGPAPGPSGGRAIDFGLIVSR